MFAMPFLVLKKVDGSIVEQWELTDKAQIIGRGEQADIRLKDDRLSRQHCAVSLKDGKYIVADLKSTNGTWLNNERITEAPLKANDRLRIGQTVLLFVNERAKGLSTIMGELEADGKGLRTYIGELNQDPPR
jgi:pSer/pThr/pTyr-binding forkhead associated (FHA) protein